MSRELYQARSKKTVKMGRDGLVETDRATGEERRVSQKETEVSFGTTAGKGAERIPESDRVPETGRVTAVRVTDQPMDRVQDRVAVGRGADHGAVGRADLVTDHVPAGRVADRVSGKDAQSATPEHGPQSRTARKQQQRQKKRERMAREAQTGTGDGCWIADYLPDFAAPEYGPQDAVLPDVSLPDVPATDAAAAMRGAADMPMFAPPPSTADAPKPDGGRAGKRRLKGTEKGGKRLGRDSGERLKPDGKEKENPEGRERAGLRGPGDVRLAAREERRPGAGRLKGGDRLRFGEARGRETGKPDPREKLKKRQTKQLAADAARPEIPEAVTPGPASMGREYSVSKLRFHTDREPLLDGEENREQTGETAAEDGILAASILVRAAARFKRPARKRKTDRDRLQFDREKGGGQEARKGGAAGAGAQKRQGTRHTPDGAKPEEPRRTGGKAGDSSPAQDGQSPVRRSSDRGTGPRLRFGDRVGREAKQPDSRVGERKRQTERVAPDAAKAGATEKENAPAVVLPAPHDGREFPVEADVPSPARRPQERGTEPRLRFGDRAGREDKQPDSRVGQKQRQTERFTPDSAKAGTAEKEKVPAENVPHEARTSHDGTDTPSPARRLSEGQTGPRLRFEEREIQDAAADQSGTAERERPRQARRFAPEAERAAGIEKEKPRNMDSGATRSMDGGTASPVPAPSPASPSAPSEPDSPASVPIVSDRSMSGLTRQTGQGAYYQKKPRLLFEREPDAPSQQPQPEQREKNRRAGRFVPEAGKRGDRKAGDKKPDSVTRERQAAAQRDTPEPSKKETAAKAVVAVTEQAEHTSYGRGRGDAPPAFPASPATSPAHGPAASPTQGSARSAQRLRFEKETGQTERGPGRDSSPDMATRSNAKPETENRVTADHPAAETSTRSVQRYGPERPRQNRENGPKEPDGDGKERQIPPDTPRQERTRLQFEDESRQTERESDNTERGTEREKENTTEREAEKDSSSETIERGGEAEAVPSREPPKPANAPTTTRRTRLRFEDAPPHVSTPNAPSNAAANASGEKKEKPTREQRQYEKAERRVEQASRKLEKAQSKIPVSRRLRLAREYDGASGKYRHRLRFETEPVPEGIPNGGPLNAAAFTVRSAVILKAHGKLREVERDNVSVEAAHKGEFLAEQGGGAFLRWNHARLRAKPYRAVRLAERKLEKEKVNLEWKKFLRDNPEQRRKNLISKWIQKQKIKRKYAAAAHEAKQVEQQTRHIVNATGQIARAVAQFIAAKKSLLATVALLGLIVLFFSTGLASCTAMLSGFQSSYISVSYMANEEDITQADLYYSEMETDLQIDIDNTEINYSGYDEYRYNVGEIAHNPFELLSYLSTKFNAFKFSEIKSDIEALFWQQYTLTRTVVVETRYDSEDEPYDWYVLVTTLSVSPLSSIASANLDAGEEMTRYSLYLQTYGDRQAYGNPFDFPWPGRVSSLFGYRKHPMTGAKNYHHGVDIGAPEGTEIKAIQDGRVVTAEELESYGLCVVIEDEKGYSSRYAHCSRLDVHVGQRVKRGDVIAAVGSTGDSTGPHLHLETKLNGEYLNPLFFVETGGSGGGTVPGGGVIIPDYPGEAPTDETFARMLEEAEKYLGYPYVWGGSNPSTSFDCSGYVSWVINHSGWNVGRLGAQALCNLCTPVSPAEARPGDLVFFRYTYNAPIRDGVTHVGIYVGNDTMIHCGSPISYANLNTSYWQSHFYLFGRLPPPTN